MTDFRTLCAELVDELEDWIAYGDEADCADAHAVVDRARAALAQPEPEGATDEELLAAAAATIDPYQNSGIAIGEYEAETECALEVYGSELIAFARAVLARWGRPAIEPVPVAERLPGDQLCWWFEADEDGGYGSNWTLLRIRGSATGYTHWLPHHALPVPQQEVE